MSYRIYLDVCCLNRPFDDWSQPRIRLEAEAILAIIDQCQASSWSLISSTALETEISRTPDPTKKQRVLDSLSLANHRVIVTEDILNRAKTLQNLSLKSFDALHIACAEAANADVFLTTDDRLLRKAKASQSILNVLAASPITWFMTVTNSQGDPEQ